MKRFWFLLAAMIVLGGSTLGFPAEHKVKEFSKWPKGSSPQEIGKRVAERFVATPHTNFGRTSPTKLITYPETVTWYGALTFAQLSGDKGLTQKLIERFDPLFRRPRGELREGCR